jgi:hypothetical protein
MEACGAGEGAENKAYVGMQVETARNFAIFWRIYSRKPGKTHQFLWVC